MRDSWAVREVSPDPGGLARYPIKTMVPVAFLLLFLQGLSEVIKNFAVVRGHSAEAAGLPERDSRLEADAGPDAGTDAFGEEVH